MDVVELGQHMPINWSRVVAGLSDEQNRLVIYRYFVSTIGSTENNLGSIADTDIRQAPLTGI